MLRTVGDVLGRVLGDVLGSFVHNWPYLLVSVVVAAALSVHVGTDWLAGWVSRRRWTAITGAVLLATFTPFCSCGTTAVVLGMLAARTPWAPIIAFMVASPLTSPSELLLSAGLFGWPFALVYFFGATGLGFAAGGVAGFVEDRGLLVGQARMRAPSGCGGSTSDGPTGSCGGSAAAPAAECRTDAVQPGAGVPTTVAATVTQATVTQATVTQATVTQATVTQATATQATAQAADQFVTPAGSLPARLRRLVLTRLRPVELARETWTLGRRMLLYFVAYTFVAFLVLEVLPDDALVRLLGGDAVLSVPLAALVGIPVYITSEGSLPMVAALMHGGLGAGAAMAFLITGAGTSIPAISGALVIARRRVVALVVGVLFVGAVVTGWMTMLVLR